MTSALAELVGPVDVVVGGPPCQGFSSIRPFRTLTEGDPRNSLVEHYVLHFITREFNFEKALKMSYSRPVGSAGGGTQTEMDEVVGDRLQLRLRPVGLYQEGDDFLVSATVVIDAREANVPLWPASTEVEFHPSEEVVASIPLEGGLMAGDEGDLRLRRGPGWKLRFEPGAIEVGEPADRIEASTTRWRDRRA